MTIFTCPYRAFILPMTDRSTYISSSFDFRHVLHCFPKALGDILLENCQFKYLHKILQHLFASKDRLLWMKFYFMFNTSIWLYVEVYCFPWVNININIWNDIFGK